MSDENIIDSVATEVHEDEKEKTTVWNKLKGYGKKGVDFVKDVVEAIKDDPEEALEKTGKVVAVGGLIGLTLKTIHDVDVLKRTDYSDQIGESFTLKRTLNNNDIRELDTRMANGQTKVQALNEMGLIKTK